MRLKLVLGIWRRFLLLKIGRPTVAKKGIIEMQINLMFLHYLFKVTFTVNTSNLTKEMMFYNNRGITPGLVSQYLKK